MYSKNTVLFCSVLFCSVLFCSVLFCSVLFIGCDISETELIEPELISIDLKLDYVKTNYFIGEKINYDKLEVLANYEDGTSTLLTDYTISPEEETILSEEGEIDVNISYLNQSCVFKINVVKVTLKELKIKTLPQTLFYLGDNFNSDNLELLACYNDESEELIKNYSITPKLDSELLEIGSQNVELTFLNKTINYEISVIEPTVEVLESPVGTEFPLYEHISQPPLQTEISISGNGTVTLQWYAKYGNSEISIAAGKEKLIPITPKETYKYQLTIPQSNFFTTRYYCQIKINNNSAETLINTNECIVKQTMPDTGIPTIRINTNNNVPINK